MRKYEHLGVKPGTYYKDYSHFFFSMKKSPDAELPESVRVIKEYERFIVFEINWNHTKLGTRDSYRESINKLLISPGSFLSENYDDE